MREMLNERLGLASSMCGGEAATFPSRVAGLMCLQGVAFGCYDAAAAPIALVNKIQPHRRISSAECPGARAAERR